jgi:hypothetical protein
VTTCGFFHVPDSLDPEDQAESCDADAKFTSCTFGPVCGAHKCRCSRPLLDPPIDLESVMLALDMLGEFNDL